ncbi:MAG: hypothetical protein RLZZ524_3217 [Pseudomonadota bacterium]
MATVYTYPDAYLATFCTEERETRAIADIAVFEAQLPEGQEFSADWTERLVIVQTYILACMENQADTEDLFTAKLKTYRQQLDILLPQAIAGAAATAGTPGGFGLFSIPLERA